MLVIINHSVGVLLVCGIKKWFKPLTTARSKSKCLNEKPSPNVRSFSNCQKKPLNTNDSKYQPLPLTSKQNEECRETKASGFLGKQKQWHNLPECIVTGCGEGRADTWLSNAISVKDLGSVADQKLNLSRQCNVAAKKADVIFGCINRNLVSKSHEVVVPLPLFSTG